MKKFIVAVLVLCMAVVAVAKSLTMHVEFSFDPDFEPELSMFKLYHLDAVSGAYILVDEVTDVTSRSFNTSTFDLPPGKTTNFFLAAVYTDGTESMSPAYSWKFTGKPTINNMDRR